MLRIICVVCSEYASERKLLTVFSFGFNFTLSTIQNKLIMSYLETLNDKLKEFFAYLRIQDDFSIKNRTIFAKQTISQ